MYQNQLHFLYHHELFFPSISRDPTAEANWPSSEIPDCERPNSAKGARKLSEDYINAL